MSFPNHDACALLKFLNERSPTELKYLTNGLQDKLEGDIYYQLDNVIHNLARNNTSLAMCWEWFCIRWESPIHKGLLDSQLTAEAMNAKFKVVYEAERSQSQ